MKCYVCKFVNAVKESRRHPNATTVSTARLLDQRRRREKKNLNHLCERHRDAQNVSEDVSSVFKVEKKAGVQ